MTFVGDIGIGSRVLSRVLDVPSRDVVTPGVPIHVMLEWISDEGWQLSHVSGMGGSNSHGVSEFKEQTYVFTRAKQGVAQ